jgi:hypothetical protein
LLILLLVWAIDLTLASLAVLVTQRIQNHATRRSCADHVHGHLVPLAPVAAARDRRIATPADGVSEIGSAATHSTSRPYSLVLDFAALWFQDHWSKLSQRSKPGRPPVAEEVKTLIRNISCANPRWGSPRIVGELHKLGIQVAKSTVEKYRVRQSTPPSPTWRAFLHNHVADLVSIDFFTVPTIRFKVLFILLVLAHDRRRVVHFNVTEHPTAHWTAQQIIEAFPWDTAPRTCYGIAMRSLETHSSGASKAWASNKFSPPLGVLGKIPTLNA